MSIDVHESISTGQKAAKRARRQAVKRAVRTVEAVRDTDLQLPDLHAPAQAAKTVAKRTAKRAAKEASKGAGRVAGRPAKRTTNRTLRVVIIAVVIGVGAGVAASIVRRKMAASNDPGADVDRDPFAAAGDPAPREFAGA
jgi:hypothetical protein